MVESGCRTYKSRTCWAEARFALLPKDAPSTVPGEVQGEGFLQWQDLSGGGGGEDGSFPFVPPACGFPSSNTEAMVLAGRVRGAELPLPGEMQHLAGFPLHSFLPRATSPAWCFWVSSGTRLMSDGATFLSHHSTAGCHRAGAGPELPCCSSPGLAPCTVILNPLLSGVPDPTSNPGRCLWSWQELLSSRRLLPGMWAAPEQGSPGKSISVCSHPSRVA